MHHDDDDRATLEALLLAPVGVDAEDLQRVQERLRKREAALRAVLEGLPDATVAAGRDGRIVFANALAEALFGYEHDELIGQPVQILWPERVRDRYTRNMELYFATEHPLRFTIRADGLRRDGTEFVGEMSWGIVETEAGPLLLAIGRDMTAHREAMARLQRQSRQAGGGGGAGRARAVGRRRLRPGRRGGRADARDAAARARGRDAGRRAAGRLGRARRGRAALRDPHRRGRVRRHLRGRRRRPRRGRGELPARRSRTCSRPRWGGCAARSGCATTRCTTR